MEFIYFKLILLLNSWLIVSGSPVAMLQYPTSSQSIIFHQVQAAPSTSSVSPTSRTSSNNDNQTKYEFKYEVSDQQTGDRKSHWEQRDGDSVRGAYTLYEPNGALRTVEYTADALHGFNAAVKRNEPVIQLHSTHKQNTGYKFKDSSNGGEGHLDESNRGYFLEGNRLASKSTAISRKKMNSYQQSVDFTVVHKNNSD